VPLGPFGPGGLDSPTIWSNAMEDFDVVPEPWRIKSVEPIRLPSPAERERALRNAAYNMFALRSEDVFVDLLTDSGTAAMSSEQWAALQVGDESYAGSRSWYRLEDAVQELTGMRFVLPVHQGRGAETVYCRAFVEEGDVVLGNLHFDTTRAHIRNRGATPVDVVVDRGLDPDDLFPFKGNADLAKAERVVEENPGRVNLFVLTVTSNTNGGQPVSLENAQAVSEFCRRHGIRLLIDAARWAENAFLIKEREPGQGDRSVTEIGRDLFSLADGVAMSAKKDALVNIGGFLSLRSEDDYRNCASWGILYEGFATYGGMAGRDLEALARGLVEGADERYLAARIGQVRFLHGLLTDAGVPVVRPAGGHSVVIDAARFLPTVPRALFPAEALAAALYARGGVRGAALGRLAFTDRDPWTGEERVAPWEYVRLALPRRMYTDNHIAFAGRAVEAVWSKREEVRGLRAVSLPPVLPHFTARFAPV
jgi:tyrosine phenol-lyase